MNTSPQPSLLGSLRELPRPVWILFAGTFLNKFGAFVIPFLALYLTGRGFTVTQAGGAMAAYGVGHFFACFIGGQMADSFGRRNTLCLSMFSTSIAMVALSQATSFPAIVTLTFFGGLTGELYRPACSALLADLVPQGQRVRAFAAYRMAFNAGWMLGPATAGLIAKYSFFWLFIGDAITSALYGVIALLLLPKGVQSATREAGWSEAVVVMKKDRSFHSLLLSSLLIGFVFFQMVSTFGLYVTQLGFAPSTYGLIISLNGLLVVLFELPMTLFSQRIGFERSMTIGYVLAGIGFGANAFATTVPALIICVVIFTIGEMLTMPIAVAHIADLAPPNMRGRYMGAFGFTWAFALTFAPLMGTALFRYHPEMLWGVCASFAFAAAFVNYRGAAGRAHRRGLPVPAASIAK
jgi:MFS family permease